MQHTVHLSLVGVGQDQPLLVPLAHPAADHPVAGAGVEVFHRGVAAVLIHQNAEIIPQAVLAEVALHRAVVGYQGRAAGVKLFHPQQQPVQFVPAPQAVALGDAQRIGCLLLHLAGGELHGLAVLGDAIVVAVPPGAAPQGPRDLQAVEIILVYIAVQVAQTAAVVEAIKGGLLVDGKQVGGLPLQKGDVQPFVVAAAGDHGQFDRKAQLFPDEGVQPGLDAAVGRLVDAADPPQPHHRQRLGRRAGCRAFRSGTAGQQQGRARRPAQECAAAHLPGRRHGFGSCSMALRSALGEH